MARPASLRTAFAHPFPARDWVLPAPELARKLLGARLVHRIGREFRGVRIVETEAYGRGDPASHAFLGPSVRNRSMFGPPGTLYVFAIHQVFCANVVGRSGEAALIRAGEPLMPGLSSTSGPGRLCRALAIQRGMDGWNLEESEIRLLPGPAPPPSIDAGRRVGITSARERPLRFAVSSNRWVSRPLRGLRRLDA
ncbi:MAG: DNA-3-methyladenine glycosylase [Thermoplasmata archaeon]|nr:DNA-3-methyladenine glycosylase [Thermoplasmata archaeon]